MSTEPNAGAPVGEPTLTSKSPITGEVVARVPIDGPRRVAEAIAAARRAGRDWSAMTAAERGEHVLLIRESFADNASRIAHAVHMETGSRSLMPTWRSFPRSAFGAGARARRPSTSGRRRSR